MTRRDPPPLCTHESGASDWVRTALGAARAEAPKSDELERLAARVAQLGSATSGPALTAHVKPASALLGAKAAVALAVATAIAGGFVAGWMASDHRDRAPRSVTATPQRRAVRASVVPSSTGERAREARASESAAAAPARRTAPDHRERAPSPRHVRAPELAPASSQVAPSPAAGDLGAEARLLQRAQDALWDQPAIALVIARQHAQQYPSGALAEERDVVWIEALVALARQAEARDRAAAFANRYPHSAHLQRVIRIAGPSGYSP